MASTSDLNPEKENPFEFVITGDMLKVAISVFLISIFCIMLLTWLLMPEWIAGQVWMLFLIIPTICGIGLAWHKIADGEWKDVIGVILGSILTFFFYAFLVYITDGAFG